MISHYTSISKEKQRTPPDMKSQIETPQTRIFNVQRREQGGVSYKQPDKTLTRQRNEHVEKCG
jgi:hypothetical protein